MGIKEFIDKHCEIVYFKGELHDHEVRTVKIKHQEQPCDDCGLAVTNRRVHITLNTQPIRHYRYYCNKCRLCRNPETGEFDLRPTELTKLQRLRIKEANQEKDK